MNGSEFVSIDGAALVDGFTDDIDDAAEGLGADGHLNRRASVSDGLAAHEALRRVESNRADLLSSEMLGDFEDEA